MQGAFKVALVVAVSLMTVTSVLVMPSQAADTSDAPITQISGTPASAEFSDVAWTPDGRYALWVGYDGGTGAGCIYRYDPLVSGAGAWQMLFVGVSDPTSPLIRTIVWNPYNGYFIAVGDAVAGTAYWYMVDSACTGIVESTGAVFGTTGKVHDMIDDTYAGRILAVGYGWAPNNATCWQFTPGTQAWSVLFSCADDETTLRGVAVDPYNGDIYVVGSNYPSTTGVYFRYSGGNVYWQGLGGTFNYLDYQELIFSDILFHPNADAMIISVEYRTSGIAGIFYAQRGSSFKTLLPLGEENDWQYRHKRLEMDANGFIISAGYYDDNVATVYGRVSTIWRDTATGTLHIKQVSVDGPLLSGHSFQSVAIRPARIPMALIAGSAFVYHYTSADSGVQVNVEYPHINFIDLYDAGTSVSRLNGQVDIDPGAMTVGYDLTVRAWHDAGQALVDSAMLLIWRDGGTNETFPTWGGSGFTSPGYENMRAQFNWGRGSPDVWTQVYPSPGPNSEITLVAASCTRTDELDGLNVTLRFRIYLHQQARAADGDVFTEAAGARYGGGVPRGQSTLSALNDRNSWNIRAVVWSGGQSEEAWDEFGAYKYTYIGSSNLPGGGLFYGSGAPTTGIYLSPSNQDLTYSANCPYRVGASVTDLLGVDHGGKIGAGNLQLTGGNKAWDWVAANVTYYFYGSPTYQNPLNSSRITTTSTGDFNADSDPVAWYCVVPTVPEDRYRGTITYSISHG